MLLPISVMLQIGSFPVYLLYTTLARGGSRWLPFRSSAPTYVGASLDC